MCILRSVSLRSVSISCANGVSTGIFWCKLRSDFLTDMCNYKEMYVDWKASKRHRVYVTSCTFPVCKSCFIIPACDIPPDGLDLFIHRECCKI